MVGDGTYMTVNEAARELHLSGWKVRQLITGGELPATTLPGSKHVRILAANVRKLGDKMAAEAAGE